MSVHTRTIAAIRFGYGFHPAQTAPDDAAAVLAQLGGRETRVRLASLEERVKRLTIENNARRAMRNGTGSDKAIKAAREQVNKIIDADLRWTFAAPLDSAAGFRERLNSFWADHFTIGAGNRRLMLLRGHHVHFAVRPNVRGRFADLLKSAIMHPAMLFFLDQAASTGPNSPQGKRRDRGLNENLAREILELHTLGVNAGYTQQDVRQFAELLTGLSVGDGEFVFRPGHAEPGAEEVLGKRYGGPGPAKLADIDAALEDLAMRPETARHLASKLIMHFVGIDPPPEWVGPMAAAYRDSGGELMALYRGLLSHPLAWELPLRKVKTPHEFLVSSLRALGVSGKHVHRMKSAQFRRWFRVPMTTMGQSLQGAAGPDGWPEEPEAWITPSALAARIRWAGAFAEQAGRNRDPRAFVDMALGGAASDLLVRATSGAETREEGVALVLSSPEFNRR